MSPEPRDPERHVVELREQRNCEVVITGPADITPPPDLTTITRTAYRYTIDNDGFTSSLPYLNPKQEPDRKDRRRAFHKFIRGNRRY